MPLPTPGKLLISPKVEALRLSLHELEGLLEKYAPMMSESIEKAVDKAFKIGAIFAEVRCPASVQNEHDTEPW